MDDEIWMKRALIEAQKAFDVDEVPVGAVIVENTTGRLLSANHNHTIRENDPTAHAEIAAIRDAAHCIGNYRLLNTSLYVTIEPCVMCMGPSFMREFPVLFSVLMIQNGARQALCMIFPETLA